MIFPEKQHTTLTNLLNILKLQSKYRFVFTLPSESLQRIFFPRHIFRGMA